MTVERVREERECPRCHYTISAGFVHNEVPQPEGANVVVCASERLLGVSHRGPMVEVLKAFFDDDLAKRRRWAIPQRIKP